MSLPLIVVELNTRPLLLPEIGCPAYAGPRFVVKFNFRLVGCPVLVVFDSVRLESIACQNPVSLFGVVAVADRVLVQA